MSVMADSCVPEPDADYAKAQIRLARNTDLAEIDRAAAGWRTAAQRMRDVAARLYGPNGTQWNESSAAPAPTQPAPPPTATPTPPTPPAEPSAGGLE